MTGIALIYNRQPWEGSLESANIRTMMHAMRHRGPDGSRVVAENGFVLGCHRFNTMTQGAGDSQPLRDSWGASYVAFDGRLDNREALGRRLGLRGPKRAELSDAALVIAAWESFDLDCFQYFEGSFAIVLLDMRRNRAVLARDGLGGCPLNYRLRHDSLLVASEEAALLAHPDVSTSINETRLVQHLAFEFPDDGSTFFHDINQVRPGEAICVEANQVTTRRFFDPRHIEPLRYRNEDDYAEHFSELLSDAVRACCRSSAAPALMLSGGLDSSALGAIMARQLGEVDAFTWRFNELYSCDEYEWVTDLQARYGMQVSDVKGDDCWPLTDAGMMEVVRGHPIVNPYRRLRARTYKAAAAAGHRVLLTGVGGDELYLEDGWWLKERFAQRDLRGSLDACRQLVQHHGLRGTLRGQALRKAVGVGNLRLRSSGDRPSWLTDHAFDLLQASRQRVSVQPGPEQRALQFQRLFGGLPKEDSSRESGHDARHGVELRCPYRSQAIASFAIAVPACVLHSPGEPRRVLRHAMRDLLPKSILGRRSKTSFIALFRKGLAIEERACVEQIATEAKQRLGLHLKHDWLDAVMRNAGDENFDQAVFWNCIGTVMWQRKLAENEQAMLLSA